MVSQRLTLEEARDLISGALTRSQTSAANADSVARALVAAEAMGQGGHGLRRVSAYAAQARSGTVDGHAHPQPSRTRPGALSIDAANGFAYPALDLACDTLPEIARDQGLAAAGIRRSHHCGVSGLTVERLAQRGIAALMLANTPQAMAPWGGRRGLFGTNPIAFAAPVKGGDPVVVDLSLSQVARGKIMAAAQKGEPIPEGWAFDRNGVPTTDPAEALKGTMAPMGGAKGTALALMVEMLTAGLIGANYAHEASSFFDADGPPPGVGQLIIAFHPEAFGQNAGSRFTELAVLIDDEPGARLPGRRRQEFRRKAEEEGILVEAALVDEINYIGR